MPPRVSLRHSTEFRLTYERGRRYDGRLLTAFVLENELDRHRLGITASRKMAKLAVERNRAKRLLREAFRLSGPELDALQRKYDWVLNARRSLLKVKVAAVIEEFQGILARTMKDEHAPPVKVSI